MPPRRKEQDENDPRNFDPRSSNYALFAHKLRTYREREGLSQTEVGASCNVSHKTISAIENLYRIPNVDVAEKLDLLFDADIFADLYWLILREAELTPGFISYTQEEARADSIRVFAPTLIPGLFQTEAYARAILQTETPEDEVDQALAVRMGRQAILARENPPYIVALIKEAALREPVGGREVHREQLDHLLELAGRHNVTIQVIPDGAPVYLTGLLAVFGYSEESDLAYVEAPVDNGRMVEPPALVHQVVMAFDRARGEALSVAESERKIRSIREAL
ncbi:XRE family transcriptional regulator [Actinomadura logoneensis]|uniref:XRE family transcriptional regulator n=1 Tax=Actinomadura logoneensis TaxID=2293572 RepID=A0A372JRY9_9ACTN|nr:helix-turn-helix transcriptional regulator [Actinomadura logoneensis]RFU42803.1 XRE family transcriptional regulator [Actinomadura logoneensis]